MRKRNIYLRLLATGYVKKPKINFQPPSSARLEAFLILTTDQCQRESLRKLGSEVPSSRHRDPHGPGRKFTLNQLRFTTQFPFSYTNSPSTVLSGSHSMPLSFRASCHPYYVVHIFRSSRPLFSLGSLRPSNHTSLPCQMSLAEIWSVIVRTVMARWAHSYNQP